MPDVERLVPPPNGVTVRMYRQGHGDCFLVAFPREGEADPYYVMIDCGYKPGSPQFLDHGKSIGDIVDHLHASCGGHLDLVILTHEHQDHLNGLWKATSPYFEDFEIDEAWLAWTEDPGNPLANELRTRHKDQLLGLLAARRELALAAGEDESAVSRLDGLLGLELGGDA
jgi:glyoxylase-like metal-dependent hydrolase (beta-lactamase superfamily II)